MNRYVSTVVLSISILFSTAALSAKQIQYVSDELTIPMRSGITTKHKILKFLNSGMALEVIEQTEDGKHVLVMPVDDDSKSGWVESSLLMPNRSARDQLLRNKKKMQAIKEQQAELKKQLTESQAQNSQLQSTQVQLQNKIQSLQNMLTRLRKNASDPIRIADENEQLKQQLADTETKAAELKQENIVLGDQNIKSWFMIGAAVSIGSLILGIILTRIRWKKNDRWA